MGKGVGGEELYVLTKEVRDQKIHEVESDLPEGKNPLILQMRKLDLTTIK